jgi:class 3 adenylate cyclase/tetratricopeptide (TPR) repeat protein
MATCAACGEGLSERARFCPSCGAAVATEPASAERQVRRTVTVVFVDIVGSTALGELLDPESLRRVMGRYFQTARDVMERHGGTIEKFVGDAVMAVFGIPRLHEDDPLRAVRATAELRDRLASLSEQLRDEQAVTLEVRAGIQTGQIVAGESGAGETLVTGDAVNTAARLQQAASPGAILLGEPAYRAVRDFVEVDVLEPLALRGKTGPTRAYQLRSIASGRDTRVSRMKAPLVGRERQVALLQAAYERSVAERTCQLFTQLGAAGVGKSRLVAEFVSRISDGSTVFRGRCLPYGEGITYWPFAQAVRAACAIAESDNASVARAKLEHLAVGQPDAERVLRRVATMLGLADESLTQDEIFTAARRLLEGLASRRPLVVVFEDIHWAEPTFLDLIDHVADWSRDAPILLLCTARPELLDQRPGWGGGKLNATSLLLEPLGPAATDTLLRHLLGTGPLADPVRARVAEASEGNPLFVEELVGMFVETGALGRDEGTWVPTSAFASVPIPPSIQALLAARIDRLPGEERAVAERASVVGRMFSEAAVIALSPEDQRADVPRILRRLVRKELVRPDASGLAGDDAFRFRHILIREAAYESIPKSERAELHERFADWLQSVSGDQRAELEELVGYHLEQAFRYRLELGPLDARAQQLADRSAASLRSAGNRARDRGDIPATVNLLRRSLELSRTEGANRGRVIVELGDALFRAGELEAARALIDEGIELASAADDTALEASARILRLHLLHHLAPEEFLRAVDPEVERLVPALERSGDDLGLARAWHIRSVGRWRAGDLPAAVAAAEHALVHAERAGDRRESEEALAILDLAALSGPTPVPIAIARCEAVLERPGLSRVARASALATIAALEAMRRDFDRARGQARESTAILEELGERVVVGYQAVATAIVEMLAEDVDAAERELIRGYEAVAGFSQRSVRPYIAAWLARVYYRQGRLEDSDRLTREAEEWGGSWDVATEALWRATRGKLLARAGRVREGEEQARRALELIAGTAFLNMRASILTDLAEVMVAGRHPLDALRFAQEAMRMHEAKGNLAAADIIRRSMGRFASRVPSL